MLGELKQSPPSGDLASVDISNYYGLRLYGENFVVLDYITLLWIEFV